MTKQYELEAFWRPMLTAYSEGRTAQPPYMGLESWCFEQLYYSAFPRQNSVNSAIHQNSNRLTYQLLFSQREDERQQLIELLIAYGRQDCWYLTEAVHVVASTCLGPSHLWSDLGLPSRQVLGEMISFYFPELHQLNQNNMRWKRFFYRQLCQQGGDYICRAPSCGECSSYSECFGD
ncbi:nitrogen fixation protein NifQ [Vibrio maritimus]|uniref:nitrogen fixation protein NifQ n=1 Tax=Vibrio maritimus TaxID=990268 RepID=UPI00373578E4